MASQIPTVTINEISEGINAAKKPYTKKVLEGILNDHMNLLYGNETPYTTGKQVIPTGATVDDVEKAQCDDEVDKKYKDLFDVILIVHNSGDLTPRSTTDGSWDPKFKPVLVLLRANL